MTRYAALAMDPQLRERLEVSVRALREGEEELWGWGRVVLFGGNGSLEVVYNEVVYLALFEIQGVHHSL